MLRAAKRKGDVPSRTELGLKEARERLLENPRVLRRKVRCVAAAGDTDQNALDLYSLAAGHKFLWTPQDWAAVLNKLDNCDLTVEEWLRADSTGS